jgi:hypothetical protein
MRSATRAAVTLLAVGTAGVAAWLALRPAAPQLAQVAVEFPRRVVEALRPAPTAPELPATEAAPVAHPVQTDPYGPLPSLDDSDEDFTAALSTLLDAATLEQHFEQGGLIRRVVVSIDNLPGGRLPLKQRPLRAVAGTPLVRGEADTLVLDARNAARYAPLVALAERLDPAALIALYRRFYPLFQQAYQDLGYPDGYFNDRLVAVIDHLLAAPVVPEPLRLVQPNVLYRFADPALEARSPGEKILLRIGRDNAARVKTVLARWRAGLLAP